MDAAVKQAPTKGADEKFCSECGSVIRAKAEICPNCGVRQLAGPPAVQPSGNQRNKTTAALLAFFLGGFGAHKFYLGRPGSGFLFLIFFWTFIPTFISIVQALMLFSMSEAKFQEKYPA